MSGNYYESLGGVSKERNEIPASPDVNTAEASKMETTGETIPQDEMYHSEVAASSIPMPPDDESFEETSSEDSTDRESDRKPDMIQVKSKKSLQKKAQGICQWQHASWK